MKLKSLLYSAIVFTMISCNGQTESKIKTVEVAAFAKEIKTNQKPQILDVRTPEEFATGHIDNALNIDWQGENFVKDAQKLDKNKTVYVYCRSGKRSQMASEKLSALGFKEIYNLDGGILKWNAEKQKAQ